MVEEYEAFSGESRERLVRATATLIQGLQQYVSDVSVMTGRSKELPALFARNRSVEALVGAWNDAASDYTGTLPLLLEEPASGGELGAEGVEEPDSTEGVLGGPLISVVSRFDLVIDDVDHLLDIGRTAYRQTHPEEDLDDAAVAIESPAHALSAIAEATGEPWVDLQGIRLASGFRLYVIPDEPSQTGVDEPAESLDDFSLPIGEVIFSESWVSS